MKQRTFRRGVHPFGGKDYAADCPIKTIPAEEIMVFPLSQHIGAPAKSVVAVGDRVLKGQLIAEAGGFISSPVYSSVSGTVKKIEKRRVTNGAMVDSIIIENDFQEEAVEGYSVDRALEGLTKEDVIDIVKNAGIVGMGGAGFPTGVKISPKNADDVDTLIINAVECEPYLTSDYRLILERAEEVIKGIKAALVALPSAKAVIGIEDNKPKAVKLLQIMVEDEEKIDVCPLKTKYPQGGERQLIYAVTGRKINSRMLPADASCVVLNTATCVAICEAVYNNVPLIHRVMTITGEGVNSPCNVDVPLGISHSYLLEQCGGAKEDAVKFISGGPMMGMAMSTLDVPVVKTSSSILAYINDEVANLVETPCIHCGRCAKACPQRLVPQLMGKAIKSDDIEKFERIGGMECIECGCCSYGCPAKIPLTQMFKLGKVKVREMRAKQQQEGGK
ncbi:MAG: electron transport complex subunit RsxC [Eubacterium sp.]|nr:electron transport complex subunit RsxC [Eubacterium sp.]